MKKRIISMVLLFSLILSAFSFSSAVYAEETTVSQYQKETDFLKLIGLINKKFEVDRYITRGEAANLIISAIYPQLDFIVEPESIFFNDVPETHQYYSQIKACKDLNIIKGDYNGNFYPDEFISVTDFVVIVINALSYNIYADIQGGYPSGYLMLAKSIGVTKDISSFEDYLMADVALKIIYNAIFADSVELDSISSDSISVSINKDSNFLSKSFNIYEYDAVVVDNGYSSIYGSSVCDGERIVIEEVSTGKLITAFLNGIDAIDYLGYRVKIFIRNNIETGRYEVVYITPHKNMKVMELVSSDIVNITASYVEYEESKDSSATQKLNLSVAPKIVYNGAVYIGKNLSDYITKDALVKFIDSDNDRRYDIVNILSFNYLGTAFNAPARNVVVDTVVLSKGEEYINCKFNPGASLNLSEDKFSYIIVNSDIENLADLRENDIVSVAECPDKIDGKTFYYLVVSKNAINGKVAGKTEKTICLEDGKEYELSGSILDLKPSYAQIIDYGEATLYLDVTGKIGYIAGTVKAAKNYAYLISYGKKTGPDEEMVIKVFTKDGNIEVLPLRSNVTIDGKECDTYLKKETALLLRHSSVSKLNGDTVKSRPIIYKQNSQGYITSINTDYPDYSVGARADAYIKQTSIPYTEQEVDDLNTLKAGWRNGAFADVEGRTKSAGGKFFITNDTLIMAVPEIDTYGLADSYDLRPYVIGNSNFNMQYIKYHEKENSDENYKILYAVDIAAKPYDIQGYDIDPDTGVAAFAVIRGNYDPVFELAHTTKMSVFLKTNEAYDEELEKIVTKVYYNLDGVELSATIDTDTCYYPYKALIKGSDGTDNPYGGSVEKLESGDVIRVSVTEGKLTHIERVFEIDKISALKPVILYAQLSSSRYTNAAPGRSTFPFDTTTATSHLAQTYTVINSYVKSIKGTNAKLLSSSSNTSTIGSIDLATANSYNELFVSFSGVTPTIVTIDKNGSDIRAEQGAFNDIITLEEAGGITGASFVVIKAAGLNVSQIVVINGLENLI